MQSCRVADEVPVSHSDISLQADIHTVLHTKAGIG
jgi:hypothetical protein